MPRPETMQNMLKPNIAIQTCRQISGSNWQHVLVTEGITDDCYVSNRTKERGYVFPLYVYGEDGTKKPNISEELLKELFEKYSTNVLPETLFDYIYGVLFSENYRKKYVELLKFDFPRIPFTSDYSRFLKMSQLGQNLIELHLMKKLLPPKVKYEIPGSNNVEFVKFSDGKISINSSQYFEGIPENVWNFYIGGYQVLFNWLKSRIKRELSVQEILSFIQIVEILKETIGIMEEIDKIDFSL
jgi:predicted helicase